MRALIKAWIKLVRRLVGVFSTTFLALILCSILFNGYFFAQEPNTIMLVAEILLLVSLLVLQLIPIRD
jgi:hypothetical protein